MWLARRWPRRVRAAALVLLLTGAGCGSGARGALEGSYMSVRGTVDLTAEGVEDWAQWGYMASDATVVGPFAGHTSSDECHYDLHCFNHKRAGAGRISDFVALGHTRPFRLYVRDALLRFRWNDGMPTPEATSVRGQVYLGAAGSGFRIEAPAETTPETLRVYIGIYQGTAVFVAFLSDGSAGTIRDESVTAPQFDVGRNVVYTFRYRAGSPGQHLTVLVLLGADRGGANVALLAATLRGS